MKVEQTSILLSNLEGCLKTESFAGWKRGPPSFPRTSTVSLRLPFASFSTGRIVDASPLVAVATKTRAHLYPSSSTLSSEIVGFTTPMFPDSYTAFEVVRLA